MNEHLGDPRWEDRGEASELRTRRLQPANETSDNPAGAADMSIYIFDSHMTHVQGRGRDAYPIARRKEHVTRAC